MAKKNKKSLHETHPILGYRVLPHIKESLSEMVEDVLEAYNEVLEADQKPYKKNDIFVMALKRGLKQMLNDEKKRRS